MTASPIFLPIKPDRQPRIECFNQPVTFISSFKVAPSGLFSRSNTFEILLPSRAAGLAFFWPLGAFLARAAFLVAFAFFGATWAPFLATAAFLAGFGLLGFGSSAATAASAVPVSFVIVLSMLVSLAVITAVHTWIALVSQKSKAIVQFGF